MIAHGDLFTCRLGVDIDKNRIDLIPYFFDETVYRTEWTIKRRQEDISHDVDYGQFLSVLFQLYHPDPRCPVWIVGRTNDAVSVVDPIKDVTVVPRVVPHRHPVKAELYKLLIDFFRETPTVRRVLAIDEHERRVVFVFQATNLFLQYITAGFPDHITDK